MKKLIALMFLFCCSKQYAQTELSKQIKEVLNQKYSELVLDNKLIMINHAVSLTETSQQTVNSEFERSAKVYQNAKLKGGRKGIVCVLLVDNMEQEIAFKKKLENCFIIRSENLNVATSKTYLINSEGEMVFDNIEASKIYSSIQSLITR